MVKPKPLKIIGIGGSLRHPSYTYMTLDLAFNLLKNFDVEGEIIDLRSLILPFCKGEKEYPDFPDVALLKEKVKDASAIILATPEYHGSLTGVLKNALDLLDFEEMKDKVCASITILGGDQGHGAGSALRHILRQLHAWVIPQELVIPNASKAFDDYGNFKDPALQKKLNDLIINLIESTKKLKKYE
jgi:FMN reductase